MLERLARIETDLANLKDESKTNGNRMAGLVILVVATIITGVVNWFVQRGLVGGG